MADPSAYSGHSHRSVVGSNPTCGTLAISTANPFCSIEEPVQPRVVGKEEPAKKRTVRKKKAPEQLATRLTVPS